jgi:hypothetical protein
MELAQVAADLRGVEEEVQVEELVEQCTTSPSLVLPATPFPLLSVSSHPLSTEGMEIDIDQSVGLMFEVKLQFLFW